VINLGLIFFSEVMLSPQDGQSRVLTETDMHHFQGRGIILRQLPGLHCAHWAAALEDLLRANASERTNTLHRTSADVRRVGFPVREVLDSVAEHVQTNFGFHPDELETHAAFAVSYSPDGNRNLKLHRDDSDVTLNLCLHQSYDLAGSKVLFHGNDELNSLPQPLTYQGDIKGPHDTLQTFVDVPVGWVAIHNGHFPHETTPLSEGSRLNVILWFKCHVNVEMAVAKYAFYYGRSYSDVKADEVEESAAGLRGWAKAELLGFAEADGR